MLVPGPNWDTNTGRLGRLPVLGQAGLGCFLSLWGCLHSPSILGLLPQSEARCLQLHLLPPCPQSAFVLRVLGKVTPKNASEEMERTWERAVGTGLSSWLVGAVSVSVGCMNTRNEQAPRGSSHSMEALGPRVWMRGEEAGLFRVWCGLYAASS